MNKTDRINTLSVQSTRTLSSRFLAFVLSVVMVFGSVGSASVEAIALSLRTKTQSKQQAAYICGQEEHTHSDACYETKQVLTCTNTDQEHEHTDECYTEEKTLVCTIAEHTHGDACVAPAENNASEEPSASGSEAAPATDETPQGNQPEENKQEVAPAEEGKKEEAEVPQNTDPAESKTEEKTEEPAKRSEEKTEEPAKQPEDKTEEPAKQPEDNTEEPEEEPEDVPQIPDGDISVYVALPQPVYFDAQPGSAYRYPLSEIAKVSSYFGVTDSLRPEGHTGLDLAIAEGTPVLAAKDGTVTVSGYFGEYGYCIFIDHNDGTQTRYGHLSQLNVLAGETVLRGQQIACVGTTGKSTGPHLHFEVLEDGHHKDPADYIEAFQVLTAEADGTVVRVQAPIGTFPADARLAVERITGETKEDLDRYTSESRPDFVKVANSYTFDIKVLDAQGNELQPGDDVKVRVSFELPEVENENLAPQVYHFVEKSEEELDAELKEAQTQLAAQQSVINIGNSIFKSLKPDAELVQTVSPEDIEIDPYAVDALAVDTVRGSVYATETEPEAENDEVIIEETEEPGDTAKVTSIAVVTDGFSYYTVEFTYGEARFVLNGDSKVKLSDILEFVGLSGEATDVQVSNPELFEAFKEDDEWFVLSKRPFRTNEWMKVTIDDIEYEIVVTDSNEITIDYSKLNGTPNAGYFQTYGSTSGSGNFQFEGANPSSQVRLRNGDTGNWEDLRGTARYYDYSTGTGNKVMFLFRNAAEMPDGTKKDVLVTYDNISLYLPTTDVLADSTGSGGRPYINTKPTIAYGPNGAAVYTTLMRSGDSGGGKGGTNANDARYVYGLTMDAKIQVVEPGTDTPVSGGTFKFAVAGVDTVREATSNYAGLTGATDHDNFSEAVSVSSGGRVLRDTPDGFVVEADSDGVTLSIISSSKLNETQIINLVTQPIARTYTTRNGEHGSYRIDNITDGEEVYSGKGNTIKEVPENTEVKYTLTPDPDYMLGTFTVNGTDETASVTGVDSDNDGYPDYYTYSFDDTENDSQVVEISWKINGRVFDTASEAGGSYEIMDEDAGVSKFSGTGASSTIIPNSHVVKYVLTPDAGMVVDTVILDGAVTTPTGNEFYVSADTDDHTISITWKAKPADQYDDCNDCKNKDACNDCHNALDGKNIEHYTKEASGVYRGGEAKSSVNGTTLDSDKNNFTQPLPYATIFIDTKALTFEQYTKNGVTYDAADIDIPAGSPFATMREGYSTTFDGNTVTYKYVTGTSGNKDNNSRTTQIAYMGGTKSYIAGVGDQATADIAKLNHGDKFADGITDYINVSASDIVDVPHSNDGIIYNNNGYTVNVVDGQNIVEATGDGYLYRITYKDATILPDGKKGDLVLTVRKIILESAADLATGVPIVLQSANQFKVYTNATASDGTYPFLQGIGSSSTRLCFNSVGAQIDWDIYAANKDGTKAQGTIAYAAKDMDLASTQTSWGRMWNDPEANYNEGMYVLSGAKAFAVVPNYRNGVSGDTYTDKTHRDSGWVWNESVPVVITSSSTDNTANGFGIHSDGIWNARTEGGEFNKGTNTTYSAARHNRSETTKLYSGGTTIVKTPTDRDTALSIDPAYGVPYMYASKSYFYHRGDDETYDTGFATVLDATGTQMRWTGSGARSCPRESNATDNYDMDTYIFDSSAYTYLTLSHGTGGGIQLEAYYQDEQCEPTYIEGTAAFGLDAKAKVTVLPEDGYRVKTIYLDDTPNDGTDKTELDVENLAYVNGKYSSTLTNGTAYTITKNSDGTYDIEFSNVYQGTNVHADFDTDYYFEKIWEGSKPIPDEVTFNAVPYVVSHDFVKIGNQSYKIQEKEVAGEPVTSFINTNDNAMVTVDGVTKHDECDVLDTNSVVIDGRHYDTVYLGVNQRRYAIIGNKLQEIKIVDNMWSTTGWAYDIDTVFGRYTDDTVKQTSFTVKKSQVTEIVDNGSQVIWKIKYPASGVSANGWPALPLEANGVTDPNHDDTETHVERIYWFANEDLSKLDKEWTLKGYDNETAVSLPGLVSNTQYKDTMWYTLSTVDHDELGSVMKYMSGIQLAIMTPINYDTKDYRGSKIYSGYGGIVTNHSIEAKLKVIKKWSGDHSLSEADRIKFRKDIILSIHRDYLYAQDRFNDVGSNESRVTFQDGPMLNRVMSTIADLGTSVDNITAFRRGVEPSTEQKLSAKETTDPTLAPGDVVRVDDDNTDQVIYMWYVPDATAPAIYYWTAADNVFLPENSSQMFKGFDKLDEITGMFGLNATKVRDMSEMFAADTSGSLTNLEYLRGFDTVLVENMKKMFYNQSSLTDIYGVIDWNVGKVNNFGKMFGGVTNFLPASDVTHPLIYYPGAYINANGDLTGTGTTSADAIDLTYTIAYDYDGDTSNDNENSGKMFSTSVLVPKDAVRTNNSMIKYSDMDPEAAKDYQWKHDGKTYRYVAALGTWAIRLGTSNANVPGDATMVGDSTKTFSSTPNADKPKHAWEKDGTVYQKSGSYWYSIQSKYDEMVTETDVLDNEWVWIIDDLLLHSDPEKWNYVTFENEFDRYALTNLDSDNNTVGIDSNPGQLVLNTQTGYYEYTLNNAYRPTLTVSKEVTGNLGSRDKYFKYEVTIENVAPGTIIDLTDLVPYVGDSTNDATIYKVADLKAIENLDEDANRDLVFNEISEDEAKGKEWTDNSTGKVYKYAPDAWYKKDGSGNWTQAQPPDNALVHYSDMKNTGEAEKYAWEDSNGNIYTHIGPDWFPTEPGEDATIVLAGTEQVEYQQIDIDSATKYTWEKDGTTYTYDSSTNAWTPGEPPADALLSSGNTVEYMEMNPNDTQGYTWQDANDPSKTYVYKNSKWWTMNASGDEIPNGANGIPANAFIVTSTGSGSESMTFDTISGANAQKMKWTDDNNNTYEYIPGHWYVVDENDTATNGDTNPKQSETVPAAATSYHLGRANQQIVAKKSNGSTIPSSAADKTGKASFTVYMQHGQHFNLEQLPAGAKYTIVEYYEDYDPSVEITGDTMTNDGSGDAVVDTEIQLVNNTSKKTATVVDTAIIDNTTVAFTNHRHAAVPTEIRLDRYRWLIIPTFALGGLTLLGVKRKRRKYESD